jgi:hypothetical protein
MGVVAKANRAKDRIRWLVTIALFAVGTGIGQGAGAAESDVWTTHTVSEPVIAGVPFTVVVGYGNHGPAPATSAFINSYFVPPMGLDVVIDDLMSGSGVVFEAIRSPAQGTDTFGNTPHLFWDDDTCEELFFQLQGDDAVNVSTPVQGLGVGAAAAFSYDLVVAPDVPTTGTLEILEPAALAEVWTAALPSPAFFRNAASLSTYSRGLCDAIVGGPPDDDVCEFIDENCFGTRLSLLDGSIDAEFELVDDGSSSPTLGCDPLVGFTPGTIALVRRGTCLFADKAFNAEQAGAVATVIVNDGRCSDAPASDQCVVNMGGGTLGPSVSIPVVMLAMADGEPIISAVAGGQAVSGRVGGRSRSAVGGMPYISSGSDVDPNPDNDASRWVGPVIGVGCVYDLDPGALVHPPGGGPGSVSVVTVSDCPWNAATEAPWISGVSGAWSSGSGAFGYDVEPNVGGGRAAVISISDQVHVVTQQSGTGCSYDIGPDQVVVSGAGGEGAVELVTQSGCEWTAESPAPWIVIDPAALSGSGSAVVRYTVGPNPMDDRRGAVLVADRYQQVEQLALLGCDFGLVTDDGTAEHRFGTDQENTYVQLVTPDELPYSMMKVCAAFSRTGFDDELEYEVVVYDTQGPGGTPGNLVASIPSVAVSVPEWPGVSLATVDLGWQVPGISEGTRYVGVRWNGAEEADFFVAGDASPGTQPQLGYASVAGSGWQPLTTTLPDHRSLLVRVDGRTATDGGWIQVVGGAFGGGAGFGNPDNITVAAMGEFGGRLFAGTANYNGGCEVFFTTDGSNWIPGNDPGFGLSTGYAVTGFAAHNDELYATTFDTTLGGAVYRSGFPPFWTRASDPGFGSADNELLGAPIVFENRIYVGTWNDANGAEVWRSSNGADWLRVVYGGFGSVDNEEVIALAEFDGELWAGAGNRVSGAQVWRSSDGIDWTRAVGGGFGDAENVTIRSMASFEGSLYAAVTNYAAGWQIWRTVDGAVWEKVADSGFGTFSTPTSVTLAVDGGQLFAAADTYRGAVYMSDDGASWHRFSAPGFNSPGATGVLALSSWNDRLYAGTRGQEGGEIWQTANSVLFCGGFEIGSADRWSASSP